MKRRPMKRRTSNLKKLKESKKEHTELKAEVKKKRNIRTLKVLEQCKAHGVAQSALLIKLKS